MSNKALQENMLNKERVYAYFRALNQGIASGTLSADTMKEYLRNDVRLEMSRPIPVQHGIGEHLSLFWRPLLSAFPDLEILPYLLFGGVYQDMQCVCCAGNMLGTFHEPWLGIAGNHQPTWIRFHAHFIMEERAIARAWFFLDVLSVFKQAGHSFLPQQGVELVTSGPCTRDGIVLYPTDENESAESMALTNRMLDGLCRYDGKTLASMEQQRFWDVRNMMWYGPSGIGTTRGLEGFQNRHQIPFLKAFPDRGMLPRNDSPYSAQITDGMYSCDFGFPSMSATHTGDSWLGLPPSGKKITMRVVDIWRREGGRLVENWVMIDMVDVLHQIGVKMPVGLGGESN